MDVMRINPVTAIFIDGILTYTIDWNSGCSVRFTRDVNDN